MGLSPVSSMHLVASPADSAEVVALKRELQWAKLKIESLEAQLRLERIARYGPASEKLSDKQLALLDLEPGVSDAEVVAECGRDADVGVDEGGQQKEARRPHPGRRDLPASLERVERVIACRAEDCACKACGHEMALIGYEESEQLEKIPARYVVLVTKREKRACGHCKAGGLKTAPAPLRILDKSLASDRIVVDTIVSKYSDHLPLYRQSTMLEREAGVEIGRGTMDGWVMRVGELLLPVVEAMRRDLLRGTYIQADETPVGVQLREAGGSRKGANHQAYLWQYGKPGGETVFDFRMGRGREGPKRFLGNFEGILQTDGYVAYQGVGGARMVHAACWAHARRKFVEALQLNSKDAGAVRMVARMDALFAVEREAVDAGEQRLALRRARSAGMVLELRQALEAVAREALPASAMGKAANYTLSLWPKLVCFLEHGELELSNNLAENSMRGVALGRKNWIHIGSEAAGPKVAAILSVVESCRRLGVSARQYLEAVLPGLGELNVKKVGERTPQAWVNGRAKG